MRNDGASGSDPFEHVTFDESFIAAAPARELTAAERAAAARRAEREYQRRKKQSAAGGVSRTSTTGSWDVVPGGPTPRRRKGSGRQWLTVGVAAVLLAVAAAVIPNRFGTGDGSWAGAFGGPDALRAQYDLDLGDYPSASGEVAAAPLGTPPLAPAGAGGYAWMQEQDGEPVTFDPCRPIRIVVNDRAMPFGASDAFDLALRQVSEATGLVFIVEGRTDEPPSVERAPLQPERYGDRWAPVLVAWTDEAQVPDLAGEIAGIGGPLMVPTRSGELVSVSGIVALDASTFAAMLNTPELLPVATAIIAHELGHLVGLDHVDDPGQLMYERSSPEVTSFQEGDRRGLARLGSGSCHPEL